MHATEDDSPRIQPLIALRALRRLRHDPQDAQQFWLLTEALRGRSGARLVQRFSRHPTGGKVLQQRRSLAAILQNRAALDLLPRDSLGRGYAEFMRAEPPSVAERAALVAQPQRFAEGDSSDEAFLCNRLRDMHDLFHVLTGYGRDLLGELCMMAFCYPQQGTRSFGALALVGSLQMRRNLALPEVTRAVRQAYRHGRYAAWIPGQPIEDMLADSLDALRARWRILPPTEYRAALARLQAESGRLAQA
ncbi:Coq4 family protein [Aquabacterium sp.]|uniref:Coq4 family protein n=1 Tax=Aquabacterium sp. TaxID=1872578 RepID=UPI0035B2E235